MSPLALRIFRQFLGAPNAPIIPDRAGISARLAEAHCFEVTEVYDLAEKLSSDPAFVADDLTSSFLPAPYTWIEHKHGNARFALFLTERADGEGFNLFQASAENNGRMPFDGVGQNYEIVRMESVQPETTAACALVILAMINTPKLIGRVQHMPHRGLEKRLLKNRKNIGRFPLRAWTEIKLHIAPPRDASGDGSVEAHYTGQRPLHFCRAHLRIKMGRIELVKAHWRGDPSLGIKRSRYKLTA